MKNVEIRDIFDYQFLSKMNYSDDGKNLVFVVSKMDEKENSYNSYLYLYRNGKIKQLTSFGKESSYIFNNDNELLLFTYRNKNEKEDLESNKQFTPVYRLPLDGGEAVKIYDLPLKTHFVKKIDEDRLLILAGFDKNYPDYHLLSEDKKAKINKQYLDDKDYEQFDEVPFYFNGAGFLRNMRNALYIFNIKNKKIEKITSALYSVADFEIIDNKIYYIGNEYINKRTRCSDLRCYDLKTKKTVELFPAIYGLYSVFNFEKDIILLTNTRDKHGLNQNPILYRFDLKKKSLELFNDEDRSYGNSTGSDCRFGSGRSFKVVKDRLYYLETRNYQNALCYFDHDGISHDVFVASGAIDDFDVSEDKIVLNLLNYDHPQELYLFDNSKLKRISKFNDTAINNKYIAPIEKISVKSCGFDIDGWVLLPKDFDARKKYPAILDIHGGPKTVYGEIFYHEMQVWTSKGYFVFFCNPFGSDGKGNEFSDIRGKYGTTDYKNIMKFTDTVLEKYKNIDRNKVCVTGGSYGGFMTNWIVGHTDRFIAAATQRSISNWISFIGTSDIGLDFTVDQTAADLSNLEKLWDHSPLKYADKVKTPLLFIHSDEDYRCPLEQGMQYYTALTSKGIETRMVIFHGENHELSRSGKPLHRIKRLTEITKWFDKHI